MKKAIVGFLIGLLVIGAYFLGNKKASKTRVASSGLIQQKLQNVSKLVVTEGHYSDIITYKDAKEIYLTWLKAEKKAVVLVNAKATVSYDLRQLEFEADQETQTLRILKLPLPELQVYPKLEYYDIQADYLNEFTATDYNKISNLVDTRLKKQIEASSLLSNAQNRLISEIYALLNKEGLPWKVVNEDLKTGLD